MTTMSTAQRRIYIGRKANVKRLFWFTAEAAEIQAPNDQIDQTLIPWARNAGFEGKTNEGRFIGPFNPFLYSADVATGFPTFMKANSNHTTLSHRVQEVVILSVGAIWQSEYELYAHSAVARKAGLSEQAIAALAAGGASDDLSPEEMVAHRFARQMTSEHRVDTELA